MANYCPISSENQVFDSENPVFEFSELDFFEFYFFCFQAILRPDSVSVEKMMQNDGILSSFGLNGPEL